MTKQEFLAMSLPYELRCQYEGIISFDIEYADDYFGGVTKYDTNHKYGKKIGILKEIHIFKKYWVSRCGIKSRSLKLFANGSKLFPILHPLSDLTKPITQKDYNNGEPFVPIKEIQKINDFIYFANGRFVIGVCSVYNLDELPTWVTQLLVKWHFNLMDEGEEFIDVNTLPENPYK